jgi:hypothetical protein
MCQTVDLQNFVNLGCREEHQFEFQYLGVWKTLKIWNRVGPTCQPQRPLKRPMCGDVLVTIHRLSPPSHVDQFPYPTRGHRERNPTPLRLSSQPRCRLHLCSAACRSACHDQPPPSRSHHRPSWGKGSPSSPLRLAPSWSSSRRSSMPGRWLHRATFIFRVGGHWPPRFNLLWANWPCHEVPFHPLLLTDLKFCSSNLSSVPPMTASPLPFSSPSICHLGVPLYVNPVPIKTLGAGLAPRHHLIRPLAAGWPKSADEPSAGGEGDRSPVLLCWAKRLWWAECIVARAWLYSVVYYFPSDLLKSIKFKSGLNFGNS